MCELLHLICSTKICTIITFLDTQPYDAPQINVLGWKWDSKTSFKEEKTHFSENISLGDILNDDCSIWNIKYINIKTRKVWELANELSVSCEAVTDERKRTCKPPPHSLYVWRDPFKQHDVDTTDVRSGTGLSHLLM